MTWLTMLNFGDQIGTGGIYMMASRGIVVISRESHACVLLDA